jgi:hypothetical protein
MVSGKYINAFFLFYLDIFYLFHLPVGIRQNILLKPKRKDPGKGCNKNKHFKNSKKAYALRFQRGYFIKARKHPDSDERAQEHPQRTYLIDNQRYAEQEVADNRNKRSLVLYEAV